MNRNTTHKRLNYLSIGMIFYALILFSSISVLVNVLSTSAAPSSTASNTSHAAMPANTPTATPTDTPTPAPTATPTNTPTPAPTEPPPPTPTRQPQPTPPPIILPLTPTDSATATTTPTATATVTSTTLITGKDDHSLQNTTNTQSDHPNLPGDNTGSSNILALSLGIGGPLLFLFGGGLFWLYLRKNQSGAVALQKQRIPTISRNTGWKSSNDMTMQNAFVPASDPFTATIPFTPSSPYAPTPLPSSNRNSVPVANMLQQPISPLPAEPTGRFYTPSDLRPITMTFPTQVNNQPAANPTPYGPTSDMSPLSLDAFDLPHNTTKALEPEQTPDQPVPAITPENLASMMEDTAQVATPPQNNPTLATPATLSVQPPDVADDPILENVMRQAQLGLFVVPGHENSQN